MTQTENKVIQCRRDTAANWASNNPVPKAGEWCFETDTGITKIGDGATDYNSLPPVGKTDATKSELDKLHGLSATKTELGYVHGVTSEIQTQINSKFAKADIQTEFGEIPSDEKVASEKLLKNAVDGKQGLITVANDSMLKASVLSSMSIIGEDNEGRAYTNPKTFGKIFTSAHSSFDLSKFTVFGSPVITDDGIASGFTETDYVSLPLSYTLGTDFVVYFPFILSDLTTETNIYRIKSVSAFRALVNFVPAYGVLVNMSDGTNSMSTGGQKYAIRTSDLTANELYIAVIKLKNQTCHYGCIHNGVYTDAGTIENFALDMPEFNTVLIGKGGTGTFTGSIDLKYFKFVANGVELISGNKTGIDTIKSDNYAVVGTPTISADGVASGLDGSNYITCNCINTDGTIYIPVPNVANDYNGNMVNGAYKIYKAGSWTNRLDILIDTNNTTILSLTNLSYNYVNDKMLIRIVKSGYNYAVSYKINNDNWVTKDTVTLTVNPTLTTVSFRGGYNADLNLYKNVVNGSVINQSCLKIPYTKGSDGKKFTNITYNNRAKDMAGQFGVAPYTIIDEENQSFILPYGSVDSKVAPKILVDSGEGWEQFLDRTMIQHGAMTADTPVTFPCEDEFADTDYSLSCPYSAKTKTGFTPTVSGEYIAVGKV